MTRSSIFASALIVIFVFTAALPVSAQQQRPNVFQAPLVDDAPSIARADLLACTQLKKAKSRAPAPMTAQDLSGVLQGTWVRQLTWYGVAIETESAMYFDFNGNNFTAMMYDKSNMGKGPMTARIDALHSNDAALARTPTMTFVDCEYFIVDKYYKVSNEILFDGVRARPNVAVPMDRSGERLTAMFREMDAQGFFEPQMQAAFARAGTKARRGQMSELDTPSVGGALWRGTLAPTKVGDLEGVTLRMDGTYRGSHVGAAGEGKRVEFKGEEVGQFVREGNSFVVTARPLGADEVLKGNIAQGWLTDCGSFFGLPDPVIWERVVIDQGM